MIELRLKLTAVGTPKKFRIVVECSSHVIHLISSHFTTFPGGGWVGGCVGVENEVNANSAPK